VFTLEEIEELHGRLGNAETLSNYVRSLAALGVARYESFVSDGHSEYMGRDADRVISHAVYDELTVAERSDRDAFLDHMRRHEQGETSYLEYYFRLFSDPDVLRGSFGFYRAWDTTLAQNEQRVTRPLAVPVLAIGGAESWGEAVGNLATDDVQIVVIPGVGYWVAEQAPEEMLAALTAFLASYRDGEGAAHAT
jgi:pimeloyl-ACP methyl ester carboxylesterase